ncbi:CaiB/BaiF CoA transferase family protein [Oceanibacterium hippocampi]|uniref:E-cinnamoyl-CoA:R-phenyllactate CoA transferase n=1 Tax=Oceanibacterium hippocampi TaxID=745714 RepID=A0A1Y5TWV6_9PROT|nr:CoA transferase [Oceanibacterium hippocampi]SLN75740.1 E-cinnamoyl-CoA:R-phenyllactate CoA transferase [Oceanibacterium hippocampi]
MSDPTKGNLLTGIRVLDISNFIAGPAAATIMADYGADVIKVESPKMGDAYRYFQSSPGNPPCELDYGWQVDNRNKRALALDLTSAAGQATLHRMIAHTDVAIVNAPLKARPRLGLTFEALEPLNPRLIYASFTAYGESGPEAHKAGFDHTALWARSGLMDTVRPAPDSPPARAATGMGDHASGMTLFAAIMAALFRRERTGKGAMVATNLMANGLWANAVQAQAMLFGAEYAYRPGRENAGNPLHNLYQSGDGRWFHLIAIPEEKRWADLTVALERPDLAVDPRFATTADRHRNARDLIAALDGIFSRHDLDHWIAAFDAAGITCGPVMRLRDIPDDVQMRESDALTPLGGVGDGDLMTVNSPLWIDGVNKRPASRAPAHGEHSREILCEFGFADSEIADLTAAGIVK